MGPVGVARNRDPVVTGADAFMGSHNCGTTANVFFGIVEARPLMG